MTTPAAKPRWYHPTPDRFFIGLLAVQVFLFLSGKLQWFAFNEHKGWTVLIAVGGVGLAVLVMLVWGLVCLLLRRRFQFSFRSLLVFLVTVSVPLGWFGCELQRARRQKQAVNRALEGRGGSVGYDYHRGAMLGLTREVKPTTPTWLRNLLGDEFFHEVVFVMAASQFDDSDAVHLQELTKLEVIELDHTAITDEGLAYLKEMSKLTCLLLSGTQVTDEGVKQLQQALPNCEIIRDCIPQCRLCNRPQTEEHSLADGDRKCKDE